MYYCDSFRFFALFTVYFFGKGSVEDVAGKEYTTALIGIYGTLDRNPHMGGGPQDVRGP